MDLTKIKKQIDTHEIIFFDVFDTLLKRDVCQGKDVFSLVEKKYNKIYQAKISFIQDRPKAETQARKECKYREVNIEEIYQFLPYDETVKKDLLKLELEVENDICRPYFPMQQLYEYCIQNHKKIYIVSDMYLPACSIERILNKNGYAGYCRIYSSCDYRVTKWENGNLFKRIVNDENLQKKDILHIGNDKVADFKMAQKQGIDAYLIDEPTIQCRYSSRNYLFGYRCMEKFIDDSLQRSNDAVYQLGYEVFGPILYGYTRWLHNQCHSLQIQKLFFFSRDGYLLKKAFDSLETGINTSYFYTSRKALIVPLMQFYSNASDLLTCYKSWDRQFSWHYLFDRFNIPRQIYSPVLQSNQISAEEELTYSGIMTSSKVKSVFDQLKEYWVGNSKEQYGLLQNYMDEQQFNGRVGIIDMGAGCSIEYALNALLQKAKRQVKPYYLYVHTEKENTQQRFRYLDSSSKNHQFHCLLRFCYMFLEIMLAAPQGTVSGYEQINDQIEPILEKNEYDIPFRESSEADYIARLQNGALDFVKDFSMGLGKYVDVSQEIALANFFGFGLTPSKKDLEIWGDFKIQMDGYTSLIEPSLTTSYFLHPKSFAKNMLRSVWPSGFFVKQTGSRYLMKLFYNLYSVCKK